MTKDPNLTKYRIVRGGGVRGAVAMETIQYEKENEKMEK